ncbi:MAG TPA: DinB family protein [Pseudacidobacterium sp.]|jgi:uncharacterized damage-inducible protein DinB|nr:DinB family protein [Pseudacidobacterium sp.]
MSHTAVTLEDLLADYEATTDRWKNFFEANPDAALVPTDIAGAKNVGELVRHIYTASFRTAQRLLGEELSNPALLFPEGDISTAFVIYAEGTKKLRQFLDTATETTLEEKFEIQRPGGQGRVISGTKRKLFLHVWVHATRHWAQIVPVLRVNGFSPDWVHDILSSEVIR